MTLRLALFDLDNTLLAGDSDFEWAQFLIEQRVLDREVYEVRNREFYVLVRRGYRRADPNSLLHECWELASLGDYPDETMLSEVAPCRSFD